MGTMSWFSSLSMNSRKNQAEDEKSGIGVLTFEVASLMSRVVHLWQCLSHKQVSRLRKEIKNSAGIMKLVSGDDDFLIRLVCAEMIDNLRFLANSVARLGKRCTKPVFQQFEHVFDNLICYNLDLLGLEYALKKMKRKVKKMRRFTEVCGSLYQELEVLAEREQSLRRMQVANDPSLLDFQKKVVWQRQVVKNLRQISLWNRTYDYTVRLLGRSLFTMYGRIKHVFGVHQVAAVVGIIEFKTGNNKCPSRSYSISTLMQPSIHPSEIDLARFSSGALERTLTKSGQISRMYKTNSRRWQIHYQTSTYSEKKNPRPKTKQLASGDLFKECMTGGNNSPVSGSCMPLNGSYARPEGVYSEIFDRKIDANVSSSFTKSQLLCASPSTLGAAALALHYANIIIVIERLVISPRLIGPDARDDLYNMLPTSLRAALRSRIKSYVKSSSSSVYDAETAAKWSEALGEILEWLAPLAHNMIRWQSERNFEQEHLISRTNVLLVQTLHFADQEKTEAAITELLVGLNYLCRFGKELHAKVLLKFSW